MDQFDRDLASGALPNFALVVPNQCDEMHGLHGPGVLPNRAITSIHGCTLTHLGEHFHIVGIGC